MGRPKQTAKHSEINAREGDLINDNDGTGINKNKIIITKNIRERGD